MSKNFFYLYLAGGIIAVGLLVRDIVATYPNMPPVTDLLLDGLASVFFLYMAFKTRREKKDQELM